MKERGMGEPEEAIYLLSIIVRTSLTNGISVPGFSKKVK